MQLSPEEVARALKGSGRACSCYLEEGQEENPFWSSEVGWLVFILRPAWKTVALHGWRGSDLEQAAHCLS